MAEETEFAPSDQPLDPEVGPAEDDFAEEPPVEERPKRSLWGLLGIIALVVIVILILLMLRGCGGADDDVNSDSLKTIEPVIEHEVQAGVVSVWVEDAGNVDAVLEGAGLGGADAVDMEDGRFVVTVPVGSEQQSVEALMSQPGVYDAGFVYEEVSEP